MSITAYQDFPVAAEDREWSGDDAEKRVRSFTDAEDGPNAEYRHCFLWYDSDKEQNFGSYKLLIVDVVDGRLEAVPRGVMAAGGILDGAHGGMDISKHDLDRAKHHLAKYYAKFDHTPPWEKS